MDLDNAIKRARRIIVYGINKRFDKLYRLTTENIGGYIKNFNFNEKNLYTVGSSGDQAINANMYGCNDITVVDINPLSSYYINMKLSAMIVFDYEDFIKFIYKDNFGKILDRNKYSKIRDYLKMIDVESLLFWDYLYDNFNSNVIKNKLFYCFTWEQENANIYNPYLLNKDNYNLAKSNLVHLKMNFINGNILKLPKFIDTADNIILSNMYDYHYRLLKIKGFKKSVNNLADILSDDGKMLVSYLYNTSINYRLIDFISDDVIENARMYHFRGISGIYKNNDITDTVVMYQKKITKQLTKR